MSSVISVCKPTDPTRANTGSILIYVLWILVVISVLAFQLTSASKVSALNHSAFANKLKKQMQLDSAIQFAMFKIISNQWQDRIYELNLNNQSIGISIFNESGFVSLYELNSKTLQRIFQNIGLSEVAADELEKAILSEKHPQRFNSFYELRQFSGIDEEILKRLIPLVSIFHEDLVNPMYSPQEVLMQIERIDQYRVQKLMETTDRNEKNQIRNELVQALFSQEMELSEDLSIYYRAHVTIGGLLHRVFLKYNRQKRKYMVVMIDSNEIDSDAKKS